MDSMRAMGLVKEKSEKKNINSQHRHFSWIKARLSLTKFIHPVGPTMDGQFSQILAIQLLPLVIDP